MQMARGPRILAARRKECNESRCEGGGGGYIGKGLMVPGAVILRPMPDGSTMSLEQWKRLAEDPGGNKSLNAILQAVPAPIDLSRSIRREPSLTVVDTDCHRRMVSI